MLTNDQMHNNSRIYVAGHTGLVGSAIVRVLLKRGFTNIIALTSEELDLRNGNAVNQFFKDVKPEFVFLAAAKVGGILANSTFPADFINDNLSIQTNVIQASYKYNVRKLMFLGSSCIYPKLAPQPIEENYLLTGFLEPTNEPYAIAKIAGIKMCQAFHKQYGSRFISVMPTNLYGPGDHYNLHNAHVIPALIRKFFEAVINRSGVVPIWGTGSARREFLHVDDLAEALYFLMQNYEAPEIINIGSGEDYSIKQVAEMLKEISGFTGELFFDSTKPDGTPRKLLNVDKLHRLGWKHTISLMEGLRETYKDFASKYEYYTQKSFFE